MQVFRFKNFEIVQHTDVHKVGTDGVLLGSWPTIKTTAARVLEIGPGTGLISLMLAQRMPHAQIDAVEIDETAHELCVTNFENSPFNDRLFCYHADVAQLAEDDDDTYDIVVCNPPYFNDAHYRPNEMSATRKTARFDESLGIEKLIECAASLSHEKTKWYFIVPISLSRKLIWTAENRDFTLQEICKVRGNPTSEYSRALLAFGKYKDSGLSTIQNELTIEQARGEWTQEYVGWTKDFHLKL